MIFNRSYPFCTARAGAEDSFVLIKKDHGEIQREVGRFVGKRGCCTELKIVREIDQMKFYDYIAFVYTMMIIWDHV